MKKHFITLSILILAVSAFCQDIDYTINAQWTSADSAWENTSRRTYSYEGGNL